MVNVRRESGNAGMDLKRPQNRKDRHWTRHLVPVLVCWRWQAQGKAIPCIGWLCRWWKVTIKSQAQIQHGIFTAFVPQAYQNHLLASVERPSKKKKHHWHWSRSFLLTWVWSTFLSKCTWMILLVANWKDHWVTDLAMSTCWVCRTIYCQWCFFSALTPVART